MVEGAEPDGGVSRNQITGGLFFGAVIQARDIGVINVQLPAQIPVALSGPPPRSAVFNGRSDDLETLLGLMVPEPQGRSGLHSVVAAVGGIGGIGKTELALQAAYTAVDRGWFEGGVLFADMSGYAPDPARRVVPGQALEGFLRAVGIPGERLPHDVEDRARLYRSVLAAYAREGRRVLVVIDNVSGSDQARLLIPGDGVNAAIVTSRHTLADLDARLLDLDTLAAQDAVALLDRALALRDPTDVRVTAQPQDARRLAELCGGLPLALQIVAAMLAADPAKPLAALVTDLADTGTRLEELTYADRQVAAAFDLSYHQLTSTQARLFRLLSANPGPDISTSAAAALGQLSETDTRHALEALARAHLIEPSTVYARWRMHDLLRLHSTHHGELNNDTDHRAARFAALLDYYRATTRTHTACLSPADATAPSQNDRQQALAWLDAEFPNLNAAAHTAAELHPAITIDLVLELTDFLKLRRRIDEWIALSTLAEQTADRIRDRTGRAAALNSLGLALVEARRFTEAVTACTTAVDLFRKNRDRRGQATALNSLSIALWGIPRFNKSIAESTKAAALFRKIDDPHGEAAALHSMGIALTGIAELDEAVAAHTQAADLFRETGDLDGEAAVLNSLAIATTRVSESITYYQRALEIYRTLGDKYGQALVLVNMASTLGIRADRDDEAVAAAQEAVALLEDVSDAESRASAKQMLTWLQQRPDRPKRGEP